MKILFYNHTGTVSGAERVLLQILSPLNRNSFDCLVVCPTRGALSDMVAEAGVACEPVAELKARFTWRVDYFLRYLVSFAQIIKQLRKEIVKAEPDLVHANSIRAGLAATVATAGFRVPVIWHLHDLLPPHPLSTAIRWFAACSTRVRLLAVSQSVADNFRGHVLRWIGAHVPVAVIHNGIDLDKFKLDAANKQAIRDELQLHDAEFVIGSIGQITPRKRQLELLEAFAFTHAQMPRAVLLVVGEPLFNQDHLYLQQLINTAHELEIADRVRFIGARNDVAAIMRALDVLVVNSQSEAFALVILEAMACGTPVVATAVGGTPEAIRHQDNGWLVPPGDEKALADALITLKNEPALRAQFATRSQEKVTARFNSHSYIAELEDFYRQNVAPESSAEPAQMTAGS